MDVYRDEDGYWFRFTTSDGRMFTGGPYTSHQEAEIAGSNARDSLYPPRALARRRSSEVGAVYQPASVPVARLRFPGPAEQPYDYARSGIPLSELKLILDDLQELFVSVRVVLALGENDEREQNALLSSPDPGIRLRSGSVWLQFLADAEETARVVGFGVTLIKGVPFIAALPGKSRAAWYNSQADAAEAKLRALDAAERLRQREGARAVVPGQDDRPPTPRDDRQ